MIQIDGLSRPELEKALEKGKMPFLKQLLGREHYRLHTHYSGLPSTTPAVQAELFYGTPCAVPSFSFRDPASGRIVRMYEPAIAAEVEKKLEHDGEEGLLKGGSAYSDNFTGGAGESHFCPSSMGWGPSLRKANPLVLIAFLLTNLYSFLRAGALLVVETVLALVDLVRGLVRGYDFVKELKFVPTRVAITILLRELCVIGGKIDISRGLPIIHINLLGYDEQSHRRGPTSLFAHWTLKGIDDAIARLWRATHQAPWRHYEVWVYSDHGQGEMATYEGVMGYSLETAVNTTLTALDSQLPASHPVSLSGDQTQRVRLLGGRRIQRLFSVERHDPGQNHDRTQVTALGPVGHLYFSWSISDEERTFIARELVGKHGIPVVLLVVSPGRVRAYTGIGEFRLPEDAKRLFGESHPFLDDLAPDLIRLCEHPYSGDLVILGWRHGIAPITFAIENGSHAGASPWETQGFALLPMDAPLPERSRTYLRPLDLRQAALSHLGRLGHPSRKRQRRPRARSEDTLRVMTYNVHSCIGMDGKVDVARIARVIARSRPDVVALQELDVGRDRSEGVDQAHQIARLLEMDVHFHPAMHIEEERYGDAILTHLPQRLVKADLLPGLASRPNLEPRGALWVEVELYDRKVQIINTHLGLNGQERKNQMEALLGLDWLGHPYCRAPVILCGDFNAVPLSPVCRILNKRLRDAQQAAEDHRPRRTFPARLPAVRIDHIYVGAGLTASRIEVPDSTLVRVASDHLPLVADLKLTP
ncbi:endonuclease/exonuclease/phosphatase family protein [Saccharospirillum sp.]|uniref:endonuclease/exonuclease/phosphatase family protein n=1 Tax=Saccharospirillum sp. TaxID=2033801 RepID=UPI0034A007AB